MHDDMNLQTIPNQKFKTTEDTLIKFKSLWKYLIEELSSQEITSKSGNLFPCIFLAANVTNEVCNIKGETNSNH